MNIRTNTIGMASWGIGVMLTSCQWPMTSGATAPTAGVAAAPYVFDQRQTAYPASAPQNTAIASFRSVAPSLAQDQWQAPYHQPNPAWGQDGQQYSIYQTYPVQPGYGPQQAYYQPPPPPPTTYQPRY